MWIVLKPEGAEEPPYRYRCSHCRTLLLAMAERTEETLPKECPACGAKKGSETDGV